MAFFPFLFSALAFAAPTEPGGVQKQNLQQIQSEVKRLEGGIQNGKQAEASLSSELGKLEKLLKLQALEIQLSAMELDKLEAHVQEMNQRRESLEGSIGTRKRRLRMALSLLPTLETRSPISRLTESDSASLDQYREMVGRMLRSDREEILSLSKILDEVESLNEKLADEKERQIAHNEDLKEKQAVLELNQKLKKDMLHRTRADQVDRLRAYQSAKAAEGELESVLSRFNLAAEVQKQKEAEAAAAAPPSVQALALKPVRHFGSSFAARKGGLPQPIDGKIVSIFGRKYDPKASLYTFHKGVDIQAGAGNAVRAVFPGKVVYSGKIGGYGQLLILDHGDQYYSLVGQLGEALKAEGDEVKEGETIGRSSLDGTPVYFEIRQRHVAVNPVPWFAKDNLRVEPASVSN
ncbi:MAG: murein hydrolase activator EnvC family protein [Bdellovibrionota bacterium]